jgi:hypothetical protein
MLIIAYLYQFASSNSNRGTKAAICIFSLKITGLTVVGFGEALPPQKFPITTLSAAFPQIEWENKSSF